MKSAYIEDLKTSTTLQVVHDLYSGGINCLGAVHMSRASPANRADSILSPLMGA